MIRTQLPTAPAHYEAQVRIPGHAFLAINLHPTGDDWRKHNYWSRIHGYLYTQLRGICMYCSDYTPRRPSAKSLNHTSVDHYVPKSLNNHLQAYEWTNFRLCRARLNNRKSDFEDVLDPCAIQDRWFQLNFTTFALFPNPAIPTDLQQKVRDTIARLGLNDDDAYVNERARAVYGYADKKISFEELSRRYPFVAAEMVAQDFDSVHLTNFEAALATPRIRAVLIRQGWMA